MTALRRLATSLLTTLALNATLAPALADDACGEKETTVDIVQCLAGAVEELDHTIDAAVSESAAAGTPEYAEAVKAAQDLFLKYREANCLVFRMGEGTIAAIEAAECHLRMTKQRRSELIGSDE